MLRRVDYQPPIPEIKVCDYEPWDLPAITNTNSDDQVWYFFCPRDYKYLRSHRSNRTTEAGYWKPTGKPRRVLNKRKEQLGTKKSLVFYIKEQPKPIISIYNTNSDDQVWYFFCPWEYKYLRSHRSNRTTEAGYWKPTGKPRRVLLNKRKEQLGTKKSLVFYIKEQPKPIRTRWIMHEYECALNSTMATKGDFVLCKLKSKADEKISEGEVPVHMVFVSDLENQNLNEMTVNSSCDEHEPSIRLSYGIDGYNNPNEMTHNMSNYEGEWTCLAPGFDCENQNLDQVTTANSTEDKSNYYLSSYIGNENPNEMAAMSTSASDFELGQNPYQKTSASSEEGELNSPNGPTLSDASHSTATTDYDVAEVDPPLSYIDELDMEELGKLIQEDKYNSAFYQLPINPNEISSYSTFGVEGK